MERKSSFSQKFNSRGGGYYNHDAHKVLWTNSDQSTGDTSGHLFNPIGLDFSWKGDLYVAEAGGKCVRVFDSNGRIHGSLGSSLIIMPKDVTVSRNDEVFVANTQNGQMDIVVLSTEGHRLDRWGQKFFKHPRGVCMSRDGHVIVSDKESARITKHEKDGRLVTELCSSKTNRSAKLVSPTFVRSDANNRILVTDRDKNEVKVLNPEGKLLFKINPKKHRLKRYKDGKGCVVQGISTDSLSNIYVACYSDHVVQQYSPSGKLIQTLFDEQDEGEPPVIKWPVGIACDPTSGGLAISESHVPKRHSCVKTFALEI